MRANFKYFEYELLYKLTNIRYDNRRIALGIGVLYEM